MGSWEKVGLFLGGGKFDGTGGGPTNSTSSEETARLGGVGTSIGSVLEDLERANDAKMGREI